MEALMQDVRYGMRVLLKHPSFTLLAILALVLGIGANTAIFSLVNAVLLRQLPFKDPQQLIWVWSSRTDRDKAPFSIPDFGDYKDQTQSVDQMSAYANWGANLTDRGDPERLQGVRASGNIFETLGVEAAAGRTLVAADDKPGSNRVAVLSYGLWKRRFGGSNQIIDSNLTLNKDSYTVVGILPPDFIFPGTEAEVIVPLVPESDPWRTERGTNFLKVIARLKPGVTRHQAQSEMDAIATDLRQRYPDSNSRKTAVKTVALHDEIVSDFRMALLVLLAAVAGVLLIACANLANMLLALASTRHKEIAIRTALGASRMRIIRQLLTESILLALFGGLLGLVVARWSLLFLVSFSPAALPRANEVSIDGRVLLFTLVLSMVVGVIFGMMPALQTSKIDLNAELKAEGRGLSEGGHRNRGRQLLVVSEVALSLLLLIGAGLFVKSFMRLQSVNPGFNTDKLLTVRLALPKEKYTKSETVTTFYNQVSDGIKRLPGVESFSTISILPLSGLIARAGFTIDGRPAPSREQTPSAQYRMIGPDYFRTMGVPLLSGREFVDMDTAQTSAKAIINKTLAQRYWPDEDPLGAHLRVDDGNPAPREVEIVGVVGDTKHMGLDDQPEMDLYVSVYQLPDPTVVWLTNNMHLVVRTSSDPMTLANEVRREVQNADKDVPASSIKTMDQVLSASVAPRRFNSYLLGSFAALALLLAAMGIYAVISYSVTQRTREIGIRMALGAQPGDVFRMVLGQTLKMVTAGIVIGLVGAFALTRVISSLLFGVSASDPVVFTVGALLLGGVALMASFMPARKATRVEPVIALRAT